MEGKYYFDAEGKMVLMNGPQADGTFYINNIQQKAYQLVEFEGNYYFINDGHKIAKNTSFYIGEKFLVGTDFVPGKFEFDAEGRMIIKNGPQADGTFYINNIQQKAYQLVEFEGNYYFINDGHKIAKSTSLYLSAKFVVNVTLSDGTQLEVGKYEFDDEGKMIFR